MSTTQKASEIRVGQVVRFVPIGQKRRITILVNHRGNDDTFVNFGGRRAKIEGESVITRGEQHFPIVRPDAIVEVVR